jgi:hypothetical protein
MGTRWGWLMMRLWIFNTIGVAPLHEKPPTDGGPPEHLGTGEDEDNGESNDHNGHIMHKVVL